MPPRAPSPLARSSFASPSIQRSALALSALAVAVVALTGCSAPVAHPSATPTVVASLAPSGDGTLRIGTLFPMTGETSASGAAQVAGTELALREITEQGGVPGIAIELVHRNSAGNPATALADLVARGVDVVLWDAGDAAPQEVTAGAADAGVALLQLSGFANGGTPLAADDAFAARLKTADPGLAETAGGGEAYDGVIVTALAATAARDDGGRSIGPAIDRVSSGVQVCASWGECAAWLAETHEIAYEGITGRRS
jgi:hypothetical protein